MAEVDENVLDTDTADEEVKAKSTQDIESELQLAMRSRSSHFKDQADSLTFEGVRRLMEKDLGLEPYALDVHKRFIKACLSECLDNGDKDDVPQSAAETVEENMATTEENGANLPIKDENSDDDDKMEDSPVKCLLTGDDKTKTKDSGKKVIPSEKMIGLAIKKRASYFSANSDDITMGGVRKLLEEDLELEKNSLLPFKKFIAEKIDHVLSASAAAPSTVKPKIKTTEKISNRKVSKNVREENSDYSDGEIEKNKKKTVESKKRKRGSKEIEAPSEKKKKEAPSEKKKKEASSEKKKKEAQSSEGNSGTSNDGSASEDNDSASPAAKPTKMKETEVPAYGKHVEKLKSIIKSCGMGVPPVVYKRVKQLPENKREAALINELKDILSKEGLSSNPSEKEIKDVRKKKERLKELEGIDMSNIVSSTRRRSSTSFPPPPPKPKLPVESDSDEGEDGEDDDEDSENDNEDGEEDHENDNDEASEEEEEEEEEEDDDGSD
ncbi:glutamic acid-rich protein-like isoform X2 [Impatiens glandulifera]|uniref:glutamic acid-rich protein-like isoform X2 n=1 Tax=Impatiens glandulifera TaxID=253017 RepID=UPI001FB0A879|nr:glutamic acid-rich protein-like isoform X2 [Impatiens glandulifera]